MTEANSIDSREQQALEVYIKLLTTKGFGRLSWRHRDLDGLYPC